MTQDKLLQALESWRASLSDRSESDLSPEEMDLLNEADIALKTPAAPWVNPHDKSQKQWLPWISEKVFVKLKSGSIHEGWHTGGAWKLYAKPAKYIANDEVEAWIYPAALKTENAQPVSGTAKKVGE